MPRPRLSPRRKLLLSIPEDLAMRVDNALLNPTFDKRQYGALSALVTSLLREWITNQPVVDTIAEDQL